MSLFVQILQGNQPFVELSLRHVDALDEMSHLDKNVQFTQFALSQITVSREVA